MSNTIKILAISGSTRKSSSNLNLIKAITDLSSDIFSIKVFEGLSELPHFNPDLDNETAPKPVKDFRQQLKEADGILICTPEYAMGVPGTLKNAIDWTVSSMEFSKKPVALITASLSGEKGHMSLLETLSVIESHLTGDTQLIIPFIKTKVSGDGIITDYATLAQVKKLILSFEQVIKQELVEIVPPPVLMT